MMYGVLSKSMPPKYVMFDLQLKEILIAQSVP